MFVSNVPSDGYGSLRDVHRPDPAAVAEGVHAATHRPSAVRRLLGLLLFLHIHHQRHGQSRYQVCAIYLSFI